MIKTNSILFSYNAEKEFAFPSIDLSQGQQALLIGASGSGKSTYMNIIGGLNSNYKGELIVANQNIGDLSSSALDKFRGSKIGIIFQESNLVESLTLEQNLLLRLKLARKLKKKVEWDYLLDALKIKSLLKQMPKTLSIGERQRANIALALITQPKVVLADEPTSALDDQNANQVIDLLKQVSEALNTTLLIITHDNRVKDHFKNQVSL